MQVWPAGMSLTRSLMSLPQAPASYLPRIRATYAKNLLPFHTLPLSLRLFRPSVTPVIFQTGYKSIVTYDLFTYFMSSA